MTQLLAGDIGGTKTILRLVDADRGEASGKTAAGVELQTLHEVKYPSQQFPDLIPMVREFLEEAAAKLEMTVQPEKACFAIAGPVVNNTSQLTNLAWSLSGERLQSELGVQRVQLINDFEAIGYGVLGLQPEDLCELQSGIPQPDAPIAVIGAGTGLGQGFLVHQAENYRVYPSEGGHTDFAPRSELEFQLLKYLLDKYGITRISVERVVSGQGIVAIYQFLRDRQFAAESPEVADVVAAWERQTGLPAKTADPAAAISLAALEKRDPLSEKTMDLFIEAYGAEAGNLALKLLPYGGLYVAGGIAAKNLALMKAGRFLSAFNHKGRMNPLLEKTPVRVVLNPQVGLIGSAICAAGL